MPDIYHFKNITIDKLSDIADLLIKELENVPCAIFEGELGSGKTTFIKQICRNLNIKDEVCSPTFSIVNCYKGYKRKVFHFDFYRINNIEEAYDAGLDEYFEDKNAVFFVEWAEKAFDIIPKKYILIKILKNKNNPNLRDIFFSLQEKN